MEFLSFYDLNVKGVYNFIFYRTGHRETAEDLTQQIFLKALQAWPSFDSGKGTPKAWIFGIARHALIDHFRTAKPMFDLELAVQNDSGDNVERNFETKARLVEAQRYLSQLEPEDRDIVVMRVWDELTYAEIGEIIGKSEAATKMIFSRIIQKLRELN